MQTMLQMEAIKSECKSKKPGIADYVVSSLKYKVCFLDEIDRVIELKPFEELLRKNHCRVVNAVANVCNPSAPAEVQSERCEGEEE